MLAPNHEPLGRAQLRALLNEYCPTTADLEALWMDQFPESYRKHFTRGIDRIAMTNAILSCVDEEDVLLALQSAFPTFKCDQAAEQAPHPPGNSPRSADSLPEPVVLPAHRSRRSWRRAVGVAGLVALGLLGAWTWGGRPERLGLVALIGSAAWPQGMVCLAGGAIVQQTETGEQQAHVKPFCVDRTLVTVAQYRACVKDGACGSADTTNYFAQEDVDQMVIYNALCNARLPNRDDHPINCVSWFDATAYCHWVGKRLLTSAEWDIAAGGQDGQIYPWGWEPPSASLLNACDARCVKWAEDHGMKWALGKNFNVLLTARDGRTSDRMFAEDDGFETTSPVGSKPASRPYGLLDLAGNVRQWTQDIPTNCRAADCPVRHILKGGAFSDVHPNHVRIAGRDSAPPALRSEMHGFRCGVDWPSRAYQSRKPHQEK